LSGEYGIGVRHGCFCAHPYLMRLLHLSTDEIAAYRRAVHRGDRTTIPGAVRASAGLSTTLDDIDRLLAAVAEIAQWSTSAGRLPPSDPAGGALVRCTDRGRLPRR
jgi:selenocysteine lyase/cysteine desulfurase